MTTLIGTDGFDALTGGGGNDFIDLRGDVDIGNGEAGDDLIFGRAGDDLLSGGDGSDKLIGADGRDELYGGRQDDSLDGGDGNDLLAGRGGADEIDGGYGADEILGGAGTDEIYGGAGDDDLEGGSGPIAPLFDLDDRLFGGDGMDELFGGVGSDFLRGDAGADLFGHVAGRFEDFSGGQIVRFGFGEDVVADFQPGTDQLAIYDFEAQQLFSRAQSFDELDSNGNGVLDDGDDAVEVLAFTLADVTQLSTIIDTEAAIGLTISGSHTLTLYGVTGLTSDDVGG